MYKAERAKALEALKKSNRDEFFKKPLSSNSHENSKGSTNLSKNNPLSRKLSELLTKDSIKKQSIILFIRFDSGLVS